MNDLLPDEKKLMKNQHIRVESTIKMVKKPHIYTQLQEATSFYRISRMTFRILYYIIGFAKIQGLENFPKQGGLILAPNHISLLDPYFVGSSAPRPIYSMAKKELFKMPIVGSFISGNLAFPIRRGSNDVGALKNTYNILKHGGIVQIYPEGTRSKNGKPGKARPGIGMLACNLQVPVVPVKIENTQKIFSLTHRMKIIFGKPIRPPQKYSKEDYQIFSEAVLEEINKL